MGVLLGEEALLGVVGALLRAGVVALLRVVGSIVDAQWEQEHC